MMNLFTPTSELTWKYSYPYWLAQIRRIGFAAKHAVSSKKNLINVVYPPLGK